MRASALTGIAVVAATLGLVLSGCGSDTKTDGENSVASSETSAEETSTRGSEPTTESKVALREDDAAGPNPTIASYVAENGIQETQVKRGDPGAPTIDMPFPEGWEDASEQVPDYYGAIIYSGPEGAEYTPSIAALVSKLTGNVDPQAIIDLAAGELQNLPEYEDWNEGEVSTLGDYPAYQLVGTWVQDGLKKIVAQKTVVIPGPDGVYVLQLNADGLETQSDIVSSAFQAIDSETSITF